MSTHQTSPSHLSHMAAAPSTLFSLSFSSEPQFQTLSFPTRTSFFSFKPRFSHKPIFKLSSSQSSSSFTHDDSFFSGRFLSDHDLLRLRSLQSFLYRIRLPSGSLSVRVMRPSETDLTVSLLAESFAESLAESFSKSALLPNAYVNLLRFLVKQYLIERRTLMPHAATLVAFYTESNDAGNEKGEEEEEEEEEKEEEEEGEEERMKLAGTVEISFDKRGANASVPSPTPPRDSPYICNMAVQKSLRRRGIGWHLLKASEELISQMTSSREVYLHCRMIDKAPFNMYTKADYKIVKTDSILVLLMLQRRKHLMCKKLPLISTPSETDLSNSDKQETM